MSPEAGASEAPSIPQGKTPPASDTENPGSEIIPIRLVL